MSLTSFISDAVGMWKHQTPAATDVGFPDVSDAPPDSRRLIRNRRYCRVLSNPNGMPFDDVSLAHAWNALTHEMALVPGGDVCLVNDTAFATPGGFEITSQDDEWISVESLYIDRDCVTNEDFARFVQSDGYSNTDHWPEEILPNVLQFLDRTGKPGPQGWSHGAPSEDKLDHPVVGICWHEANAYATWAGKRLPSSHEWQRAGTWPGGNGSDAAQLRYPWGNAFDPSKANTWAGGSGGTVPVNAHPTGNTPNGVRQLIGNVWEWIDAQFYPNADAGVTITMDQTMAEIRGGAFDTYFHSQATCQFRTGQPLLHRGVNVGFRCCISASDLPAPVDSPLSESDDQ